MGKKFSDFAFAHILRVLILVILKEQKIILYKGIIQMFIKTEKLSGMDFQVADSQNHQLLLAL